MKEEDRDQTWPPFRPDLSLITYLEKGTSDEEIRAIFEEPDEDEAEPGPENPT